MIAEIEIFSRAMRRLSTSRSGLIRVDYIDVDASTDRLQELERPRDAWDLNVIGAVTSLIVDCADFDQIDADECREQLITVFERLADRCASMEHDVSSMPKAERDIFVDVVWIMDQLVNSADAKDKAKWERLVNTAVNVAVIEKLPPLMRRELLLCLKSVTQGCVDTSGALKDALYPDLHVKRSRRGDSTTKLHALKGVFLTCGDFSAQKHITEILFRLCKANLLDQDAASTVFTHVSSQFKDLFNIQNTAQMFKSLKTLVRHFNAAQGSAATVKSFEAKSLTMEGLRVHDNWINFGEEMFTVHVCLEDSCVEPVDILYSNIRSFNLSENHVAHIGIREKPLGLAVDDPFDVKNDEWIQIEFHANSIPGVLEQLFRISKHSEVVQVFVANVKLPTKKMSVGLLDVDLLSESESAEPELSPVEPTPVAMKRKAGVKPKPKRAPRKTGGKAAAIRTESDDDTESEDEEPKPVATSKVQASRRMPKRKAKQDGIKKLNEQMNAVHEMSELAEEPESSPSSSPLRFAPPPSSTKLREAARKLRYSPKPTDEDDDESDEENEDTDGSDEGWTAEDIPALMKMIKAKGTTKTQRAELQRVVDNLRRTRPPAGKSVFKTPAASIQVPKTGNKAGILKSFDKNREKKNVYDSVVDWKKRAEVLQETKTKTLTTTITTDTLNFDDDDDANTTRMTDDTPLSALLNGSDDVSPLLSGDKPRKKARVSHTPMKSLAGMGDDDMAGFQDMMQSIVERNRRIAQERIDSLVNEFRLEADAVSRKLSSKIEKDYDGYSRSIHQRATARAQESKAIASKINNLAADYKSALRVAYDEFNSNKRAAVADAARFDEELAALDAALASDVKKTIAKLDVKKRRVEADITAARRAVHERGGVKSMLLELARNM